MSPQSTNTGQMLVPGLNRVHVCSSSKKLSGFLHFLLDWCPSALSQRTHTPLFTVPVPYSSYLQYVLACFWSPMFSFSYMTSFYIYGLFGQRKEHFTHLLFTFIILDSGKHMLDSTVPPGFCEGQGSIFNPPVTTNRQHSLVDKLLLISATTDRFSPPDKDPVSIQAQA